MGRNRQQRRRATVYRLEPMFQPDRRKPLLATGPEHHIEGELSGYLIVSVPPTASHESCGQLQEQLGAALGRPEKNIVIVTHNIEFLRVRKLTPAEAAKLIRDVEERAATSEQAQSATEATA
jgi:hypothetical protein